MNEWKQEWTNKKESKEKIQAMKRQKALQVVRTFQFSFNKVDKTVGKHRSSDNFQKLTEQKWAIDQ